MGAGNKLVLGRWPGYEPGYEASLVLASLVLASFPGSPEREMYSACINSISRSGAEEPGNEATVSEYHS